jgi:hypothetical protein
LSNIASPVDHTCEKWPSDHSALSAGELYSGAPSGAVKSEYSPPSCHRSSPVVASTASSVSARRA